MALVPIDQFKTGGSVRPSTGRLKPIDSFKPLPQKKKVDPKNFDNYRTAVDQASRTKQEAQKASSFRGMAGNFLKAVPRATADILAGTPAKFIASTMEAPKVIASGGKTSQKEYKLPGLSPFKSYQSDFKNTADDVIAGRKGLGSAAWGVAQVPLAGLETLGIGKGLSRGMKAFEGANTASQGIKKALPEIADAFVPTTRGIKKPLPELPPKIPNRQQALKVLPELGQDSRVSSIESRMPGMEGQNKIPTQTKALELSDRLGEDFSYENTLAKQATNVKDKINALDFIRTPDRVMKKIGLEKEMNLIRKKYDKYIAELPKEIDKIDSWTSKLTQDENVNIFKHLDGENVPLSAKEQKIAGEIKDYLEEWADKLKLPKEKRISNYITHIFDGELSGKEFDEDLAKIIDDNVAGSVYDPFTLERLGAKGYVQDTRRALEAYVKRATRKVNMDVALEQVKSKAENLELSQYKYVKNFVDRINLRPTDVDNYIDNTVKSVVGYRFGQRPVATLSREMRKVIYRGALGLNVSSTLKNLSQGANTFAKLGAKYTATGYANLIKNFNSKELTEVGVLADNFIQDKTLSAGKKALQKADKVLFSLFETAEKINRGAAYYGAKAKAINEGLSELDAIDYAKKIVRDTQFTFGSIDTPPALQSDIGKTIFQFQSFSLKQAEFLTEMAMNKEWAGLIRWTMASLGFVYGIGKSFGMTPKDLIPTLRLGVPPTMQVPAEAAKALLGAPNEYGQPTGSREIMRAATPLVPAGVQAKKTLQGVDAYNKGYSGTATDRVRYPIQEGTANRIKTGVFGQYSVPEAREYFDKNRSSLGVKQSESFRQMTRKQQKEFYDKIIKERENKRNPFYQ